MVKMKLPARPGEAQNTIEQMQSKLAQIDRARQKMQIEIDEVSVQVDRAHILNSSMEAKARNFVRFVNEWKTKVDGLSKGLDTA